MRIIFNRSGGFTGIKISAAIDTQELPPEEAEQLCRYVEEAGFFDLPPVPSSPGPGADRFSYSLTVIEGSQQHTVEFSDADVPEELRPLLRKLTLLARRAD
jgi:hypothetical protein